MNNQRSKPARKKPDIVLLLAVVILVTAGTVMIYSSSSIIALERFNDGYHFLKKQIIFVFLGFTAMIIMSKIPYFFWRKVAYPGIFSSIILLCLLLIPGLGAKAGGATRWLNIGGFSFQVVELVKVALILFLAHFLAKKQEYLKEFKRIFVIPLTLMFVIIGLMLLQPDFGSSAVLVAVLISMLFIAGCRISYLIGLGALFAPCGLALIMYKSYRLERVLTFLNPWKDPYNSGFQIIQSLVSFGTGGTFGVGLGNGMQKLFYLPEPHTDFILSVIAEEGGFISVALVISLFVILVIRGYFIAINAPDFFGTLLCAGLTTILGLQAFINMAGVMGLIPTKGLALPFLSYGGTAFTMSMVSIGMLLNVSSYQGPTQKHE